MQRSRTPRRRSPAALDRTLAALADQAARIAQGRGRTSQRRADLAATLRAIDTLSQAYARVVKLEPEVPRRVGVDVDGDRVDGPECETDASEEHGQDVDHDHGADRPGAKRCAGFVLP